MTEVPHLFVGTKVIRWPEPPVGLSAEGLPPKWFTKNPATTFEQDLPEMLGVISHARDLGGANRPGAGVVFRFLARVGRQQSQWADARHIAPLLANLGVSLVERAVLDGLCRDRRQPFHRMLPTESAWPAPRRRVRRAGRRPAARLLPAAPLDACFVRHTVGLGDALRLPTSRRTNAWTTVCRRTSRVRFALTVCAISKSSCSPTASATSPRLRGLASLLERETGGEFFVTLDGNENFKDFEPFREFWQKRRSETALRGVPAPRSSWSSNRCIGIVR